MAPLPVIANVFRVALTWSQTEVGSSATNVMHFRSASGDPATCAAQFIANADAQMWNAQGTHAAITHLDVTPLDGGGVSFPLDTGSPANLKGARTTNTPMVQVCSVIKLVTAKRGRSYRGRIFLPWIDEAATDAGVFDSSITSLVTGKWATFMADMASDSYDLVVASYTLATAEDVVAIAMEKYTATQRRRLHRTAVTA